MLKSLHLHSKIWLEKNGRYAFGGGIARILSAIRDNGSIKDAAGRLKQSYRYVWGRIRKTEQALGRKLVETSVGGTGQSRTHLTPFAGRLLKPYIRFETNIRKNVDAQFRKLGDKL
ncbi:MAG: LysR family transcriptional regulator [Planctomycetes bacterium]|nr:LysR family transcriptional regulator [Planctomycetota bacterium]